MDGKTDPERRPFKRAGAGSADGAGEKRTFSKPWNEDRKPRPAAPAKADGFTKFRRPEPEDRAPLGPREQAGLPEARRSAPKSSFDRASKPSGFAKRPYSPRGAEGGDRGSFKPRSFEGKDRAGKPGGFGAKRPYTPRATEGGGERPFVKRSYTPRAAEGGEGGSAKRTYTPRATEGGERGSFKPRSFEGKERGTKPGGFGAKRPYTPRSSESGERSFAKRPYTPRSAPRAMESSAAETSSVERTLPKRPYKPRAADAHERPFTKAPWVPKTDGDGAKRPYKARGEGGFGRSGSGPRKSFSGKPAGKAGGRPGGFVPRRGGSSGGSGRG